MYLKKWHIFGFLATVVLGSLWHFLYEWTGESSFVGLFTPVNESVWEHLKILFFPMLLWGVVSFFVYGKYVPNFAPVLALSMFIGMVAIVVVFYTYTGIVGKSYLLVDIAVFVVGALLAFAFSYRNLDTDCFSSGFAVVLGWVCIVLWVALFICFTLHPPEINLFLDPVTKTYGIR